MCKKSEQTVPSIAYASSLAQSLGLPAIPGEGQKSAIARGWRNLLALRDKLEADWTHNRFHDLWIGRKAICVRHDEVSDLERANALRERDEREQSKAASDELRQLYARLDRLETLLLSTDEAFHRPQIDSYRAAMRPARGMDSAVDQGEVK